MAAPKAIAPNTGPAVRMGPTPPVDVPVPGMVAAPAFDCKDAALAASSLETLEAALWAADLASPVAVAATLDRLASLLEPALEREESSAESLDSAVERAPAAADVAVWSAPPAREVNEVNAPAPPEMAAVVY